MLLFAFDFALLLKDDDDCPSDGPFLPVNGGVDETIVPLAAVDAAMGVAIAEGGVGGRPVEGVMASLPLTTVADRGLRNIMTREASYSELS